MNKNYTLEANAVVVENEIIPFWGQFDMVICITKQGDHENKHESTTLFKHLGIPVRFLTVPYYSSQNAQSKFEAHQLCLKLAYESQCKEVLVFEDNIAKVNNLDQSAFDDITRFIHYNKSWDLFYLSTNPSIFFNTCTKVSSYVFKVHALSSHAYIASRQFMKKMLTIRYDLLSCSIDYIYQQNNHAYGILPTIFLPVNDFSVITHFKIFYACVCSVPLWRVIVFIVFVLFVILCCFWFLHDRRPIVTTTTYPFCIFLHTFGQPRGQQQATK